MRRVSCVVCRVCVCRVCVGQSVSSQGVSSQVVSMCVRDGDGEPGLNPACTYTQCREWLMTLHRCRSRVTAHYSASQAYPRWRVIGMRHSVAGFVLQLMVQVDAMAWCRGDRVSW